MATGSYPRLMLNRINHAGQWQRPPARPSVTGVTRKHRLHPAPDDRRGFGKKKKKKKDPPVFLSCCFEGHMSSQGTRIDVAQPHLTPADSHAQLPFPNWHGIDFTSAAPSVTFEKLKSLLLGGWGDDREPMFYIWLENTLRESLSFFCFFFFFSERI